LGFLLFKFLNSDQHSCVGIEVATNNFTFTTFLIKPYRRKNKVKRKEKKQQQF